MKPSNSLGCLVARCLQTFLLVTAAALIFGVSSRRAIAAPVLVEFMASNDSSLYDEDGQSSDWIEIFNPDPTSADISGWFLTNDPTELDKWELPAGIVLPSGGSLIVFASNKDRDVGELHTNFKLSKEPEGYLTLVEGDGQTVANGYIDYPEQFDDISYGLAQTGSGSDVTIIPENSISRILVPTSNIGTTWHDRLFDDSSWPSANTGIGYDYGNLIGSNGDVQSQTDDINGSVYVRIPFTIDSPESLTSLTLRMKYDDGFAAYINGTLVASAGAPASPQWNSVATEDHPDSAAVVFEDFDIPIGPNLLETGGNILAIHGLNRSTGSSDLLVLPRLDATTAATNPGLGEAGYFQNSTPATSNGTNQGLPAGAVTFSVPGRGFTNSVSLELSVASPNADIRYTTNGNVPNASSTRYTGNPISITSSQIIRARAYSNGLAPGPVSEEGYIELSSSAESFSSDIPVVIMERFSGGPTASNGKAYVFFAFFEPDPATGITRLNKPYSLGTRGGYKTRGSSSSGFEKKAYSIEAWNENNRNKDISPFGMPEESDWILNARSQFDRSLMRNAFIYNLSNQTGRYAMRTRFVELFLNTNGGSLSYGTRSSADYDGVYTFMEKISRDKERVDVERLPDSVSSEPGITGGYIMKIDRLDPGDGGLSAGGRSLGWVYPKEEDVTSAQATWLRNHLNEMTSSLSSGNYEEYIDPLAWVDHHLLNVLALNADALRLSTYFHKKRSGKVEFGPIWDFDRSMDSTDSRDDNPRSWSGGTNYFTYAWWNQLFGNEEFWQLYIDRYFELRKDVWTNENVQKIIADYAAELNQAQVRNFQRFSSQPRFGGYAGEVEHLRDWLTTRLNWMDGQFVPEPTANLNGGTFPAGTTLSLSGNLSNGRSIWYTLNGTDPRFTSNTTVLNTKTLVDITAPAKALVPTSNIGTNWRGGNEPFDDSSWIGGTNGVGFDSASTYNPYININLEAPNPVMSGVNTSAYVRIPFNVAAGDIAKFNYLTLQMRYDDGFVAFLNGTRIASGNAPGSLNWNSSASQNNDDGIAVTFIDFGADAFVNALKSGENILAIHGLNGSSTSSDFLIQARLVAGEKQVDPGESGGIEYTGPITLTETARLFARISDPRGGSNPGSGVPVGTGWGAPLELEYLVDEIPADSTNLVIREIMFDPYDLGNSLDEDSNFEFIELENISETKISLSDASFTRGVTFDFSSGSVRSLSPGGKVLVVNDLSAFQKIYGEGRNSLIAGEFGGSLNNDGELLELRGEDSLIQSINFASSGTWPTRADNGRSLVLVDLSAPSNGASWTASRSLLGSPGRSEPSTIEVPNIYVNEVITNGAADAIEIFNPNGTSIDLGGWWLTDDLGKPEKFKISNDSIIPPNGFLVFNESDFNPDPEPDEDTTETTSFGLSSGGEEVFLLSATPSGERTDYVHGFTFGDSAAGFSFGRHVNSIGKISYPPLEATSFNASNDSPRAGPLVITEMMYHPANGSVEFIEIQNISGSRVPLVGVQIAGIGFVFGPTAPELIPGEVVLVVENDPATFRSTFNPPASVGVFGPYSGRLSNGGEKVSLKLPEANPIALEPDLMPAVDITEYNDSSPWPTSPDGTGTTLVRILPALYGSDPNSWLASLNPGGTPGVVNSVPPIDWRADYFSEAELLDATISGSLADADSDGVSNLLEHVFGTDPRDASSIDLPSVAIVSDGGETYAELSYRLRQGLTGFRIRIEASSDLAEWRNADGNFTIQSDLDNGDGTSTLTARDENSVGAQLGRYFRIRVN
ncbi:lamin tail domain-containing protein [Akkermansiaceae bacterium]|nr:lamin tail domain-containing protein [Akkermansiaceae bacterium]